MQYAVTVRGARISLFGIRIRIRIRMIVEKNIRILSVSVYQFLEITSLAS